MNCDTNLLRVTLFDCRAHDRPERIDGMIFVDDVPDLHQIGFLLREFAHELARLIGRVDLHYWRIAEIELLARDAGDERARNGYARRFRSCIGLLADLE